MTVDPGLIRKLSSWFIRLPANLGVAVYRSTSQVHNSSGNWVYITFDTQRWDTGLTNDYPDGFWEGVTNPTRLTAVKAGWYVIDGGISFAASNVGVRAIGIHLNGTTFIKVADEHSPGASDTVSLDVTAVYWLNVGDYVRLGAYQNTGGNLTMNSTGNYSPEFRMVRIP